MSRKLKRVYESDLHPTKKLERVISARNDELVALKRRHINVKKAWDAFRDHLSGDIAAGSTTELLMLRVEDALRGAPNSPHGPRKPS